MNASKCDSANHPTNTPRKVVLSASEQTRETQFQPYGDIMRRLGSVGCKSAGRLESGRAGGGQTAGGERRKGRRRAASAVHRTAGGRASDV